jgi:hypothetical protein
MRYLRLQKNAKTPLVAGAFAGENSQLIDEWIKEGGNVGLLTGSKSNIAVIDIDNHHGVDGVGNLQDFLDTYDIGLPPTKVVKTPSGGLHYYFKLQEEYDETQFLQNHPKLEGVDFQTHGRYVVAPPSKLPKYSRIEKTSEKPTDGCINISEVVIDSKLDTKLYSYDKPTGEQVAYKIVRDVEMAYLPLKWIEMFTDKSITKTNKKRERKWTANLLGDIIAGCPSGGRNIWVTSVVGRLFATGLEHDEVWVWTQYANQIGCNPPLDEVELSRTYESVKKREIRRMSEE